LVLPCAAKTYSKPAAGLAPSVTRGEKLFVAVRHSTAAVSVSASLRPSRPLSVKATVSKAHATAKALSRDLAMDDICHNVNQALSFES
jgi:hypothetical protein